MNKENFISLLRSKLYDLPYNEVDKIIEYYIEYIEDAKESGKSEDEIVEGLGDINLLIGRLRADLSFKTALKKPTLSNGMKVLIATLGLLSIPIAFPIAISIISVIFALFVTLIAVGISLFVALIAVIVAVIGLIIGVITTYPNDSAMIALAIGGSLIAVGVIALLFTGFMALIRLITKAFIQFANFLYNKIIKKSDKNL